MVDYQQKHQLIWFSIFPKGGIFCCVIVLGLCSVTCYSHKHQTPESRSLVNANLVRGLQSNGERDQNIELRPEEEDMPAMVASLGGGNYDTSSVTETKWGEKEDESNGDGRKLLKCDWQVKLDQLNRYRLDWTVDYAGNSITFALNINHTSSKFRQGFDIFALGFSKNGELSSSDFCIIWYDLSHKLHLQDAQTDAQNRLQLIDSTRSQCKLLRFPLKKTSIAAESDSVSSGRSRAELAGIEKEQEVGGNDDEGKIDTSPKVEDDSSQKIEIIFTRPLDVCNPADNLSYYRIDNGTTHLVWFTIKGPLLSMDSLNLTELVHKSDEVSRSPGKVEAHHNPDHAPLIGENEHSSVGSQFEYGLKRVQLIANKVVKESGRTTAIMSLDIRMEQYEIPAKETTYWCKLFKLPHKFETRRYHLTEYEAVIEKGNEHVVHHMELFNCANLNEDQEMGLDDLYAANGWSGDCGGSDRPEATKPCRRVILAWAMGAHPLVYPEQVGQSIGGHNYSPYVVLEVHYNNVGASTGLIDNSGLRFHYTSKLRPYDAGIIEVGLEYTDKISIPPGLVTPIAGHCVSECTRASMSASVSSSSTGKFSRKIKQQQQRLLLHDDSRNLRDLEDGIYIFAAQMHTHLTGVASWTEIVREGKLVGELQRDNHYSPHFQEIRLLPAPVHVAPGDSLIHYCLYDTKHRVNITLGGFATNDEMCVTYLHYYPRIDLEVCKSSVDTSALEAYFAYLAEEEAQNTSERLVESGLSFQLLDDANNHQLKVKSVSENYHSIKWTPRRSKELIQFYANAPLSVQCNRSNGERWPGHWNGLAPTKLWSDLRTEVEPFEYRLPKGDQLIAYRGRKFEDRHAQCKVSRQR